MLVLLALPETEADKQTKFIGTLNTTLSEEGKSSITELLDFFHPPAWFNINRLYIAPQYQFKELANLAFPNIVAESIIEFNNRDMGSLTGMLYKEAMQEFPRRNWLAWERSFWIAPPDGESLFDISDRVLSGFCNKILPISAHEVTWIIAPVDVLKIIIGFVTHANEDQIPSIGIEPMIPHTLVDSIGCP